MKRELFIVRHAKSSWELDNISDVDRPLSLRGIRNAYEMARRLKIDRHVPDSFITSPANRAMHTAVIFLNVFELSYNKLTIEERLYGCGAEEIINLIRSQPTEVKKLMIVGHNPDFTELVNHFSKKSIAEIPTCGIVILTFNASGWSEISKETLTNESIDFPKKG